MGRKGKKQKAREQKQDPSQQQQQQQEQPGASQQGSVGRGQQQEQPGAQQEGSVRRGQQQEQPGVWQQRSGGRGQQQKEPGKKLKVGEWKQDPSQQQHQQQEQPGASQQGSAGGGQQQEQPSVWQKRSAGRGQQQEQPGAQQQGSAGRGQQQEQPNVWQQRSAGGGQQQEQPNVWQQRSAGRGQQQEQPGVWQQRSGGRGQQQKEPGKKLKVGEWKQDPSQQQHQQQEQPGASQQGSAGGGQQQEQPSVWQKRSAWPGQQQEQPGAQQQRSAWPGQQQEQPGAQQQRSAWPGQQQEQPGAQQQRSAWPGQQQQQPGAQQQRSAWPGQQQQQPGVWQQRPAGPGQQQEQPGVWQQRPAGPGQQQEPPGAQQQGSSGHGQQQERPSGPQQQQQASQKQGPPAEPVQQQPHASSSANPALEITTYGGHGGNMGRLTTAMQNMYLEQIPKRKCATGGTDGRRITVETNMLKINFNNFQTHVVHYDVVINPDKPKFLLRPVFEAYQKMHFPNRYPAFDGKKNVYSAKDLPFGDESPLEEVKVFDAERQQQRTFKVYLKKAAVLDLSWLKNVRCGFTNLLNEQKGMQALDIILRHGSSCTSVNVGRSLFPPPQPGRVMSLSNGLDLWVGVFQSAVIGWKPYLNVDVAHKGFPTPQSIIDLMKELCKHPRDQAPLQNITPLNVSQNHEKISKFLKGLKVQYEIPGQPNSKRTYRVNALSDSARRNQFTLENGQACTVENYFAQQKKYRLQYPELPCLWVGSRNNLRRIHLPAELCMIVAGQVTQKKMDESQTAKMVRFAATDTRRRKEKIMNGFARMRINDQPTLMREFNLSVSHDFEKVPARVLEPPQLEYAREAPVKVMKGVWRADRFLRASNLADNEWTILNLDGYTQESTLQDGLHRMLREVGRTINMNIGRALTPFTCLSVQYKDLSRISAYFAEKKKQNIKLVVVIIPNYDNAYSVVKQMSELRTEGGIVTQVLKVQTLKKLNPATVTNILLKINSKLNGVNHRLMTSPPCLSAPCMLVGADVTHPSPDATDIPSIAAVAASHTPTAFQYNIELRLQPPREEMIQDLEEIMIKQLTFFYTTTRYKPQSIIFYRDGVSEGQLTQVMHYEMSAIKRAIARMGDGEAKIPITFLVVQKRHHTRFFPTDPRNSDDRNMNVQAGTIVDTEITHPTHIDFYLVSHASIQGTARPTKYRCIANEAGLSENEIEQLTYYLCHLFARCTRSVSYPAPTYYAHLAAFRARALIQGVNVDINNLAEEQKKKMTLQMQNSPMFFV